MDSLLLEQDFIMIRPYHPTDSDAVLDLWLRASILAHDFVPESFWREQLPAMRELYLPQAETLVLEEKGQVLGFASLHEQRLAALFVNPDAQGRGLGRRLLDDAKSRRDSLELGVYRANARAVAFYRAGGFVTLNETRDPHTGQPELTMRWSRG
ncbi:N-acetyltransferase [Ectopseudomonas guguanensis]|jgi:putative acetyltransferase|uniref:N-acetyltransferase n=1 Tax=Ectopseudomonas guguanensis TaxID=1198456 RepID=UPI00042282D5|nr:MULTISPECIES: N-acetyltransferase [Pseudomonas]MDR8015098.1 N-acetyltransferase [Pseudomonas guguanensis]